MSRNVPFTQAVRVAAIAAIAQEGTGRVAPSAATPPMRISSLSAGTVRSTIYKLSELKKALNDRIAAYEAREPKIQLRIRESSRAIVFSSNGSFDVTDEGVLRELIFLSYYFEYSHTVIYRTASVFQLHFIDYEVRRGAVRAKHRTQRIQGHHPIFRPGGTWHLVYIDDVNDYDEETVKALEKNFDVGLLECGKDFDENRGTTG